MKKTTKQLIFLTLLIIFTSKTLFAQLTGTKTIGTGGDYTTFPLAVTDLNTQGVGVGGVIFEFIDNGGGNYTETLTVGQTINPTTNAPTATNTVIFRPSAGLVGTVTLTGAIAGGLIFLNANADYITLDGQKGGAGTTRNLTIINTNTTSPTLFFSNGASNNQILYTKIQCRNASTASGAIIFGLSTGGNNNNLIDNNEISPNAGGTLANCIYSQGSPTLANFNANNVVSNNLIFDYFVANSATNGVFLSSNNQAWSITNNRFYQTVARTYTTIGNGHRAINIQAGNADNFTVTGNIIGFSNSGGGGTYAMSGAVATSFRGITINTLTGGVASNVKNNTIQNISLATTSGGSLSGGYFVGIEVITGNVNIGGTSTEGNFVGDNTTTGNISLVSTSNAGFIQGILNIGAGVVNIQNNKIGSILSTGSTSAISGIVGIHTAGSGVVANNVIGSTTIANSINTTTTATVNNINVIGINSITTTSLTIDANIIANLNNGHPATTVASITRGINVTTVLTGALTVTNNEIYNITTSGVHTGTGYTNAVLAGISCNSANTLNVTSNKVYNLRQTGGTNAISIYGIVPNNSSLASTASNNLIYNLFSTSTNINSTIYGIRMSNGAGTCANNVIRLGENSTNTHIYYGIWDFVGNNNYYYNTIYIGGVSAGVGARSFAFAGDANNIRNLRNNILVNLRTNAIAGTNKHYAATFNTSGTQTSNYNIFYATGTDGILVGRGSSTGTLLQFTTFQAYRVVNNLLDANSAFGNPQLQDPTNATAPDLSLGILSPAFQNGIPVGAVTIDYANVARSATTPNIGAYETATTAQNATTDIFTPSITYTPLSTPYGVATGTRTLTATITDVGVGVPVSGANVPYLYYQNTSASGAWQPVAGTLTSGNGNNGTWDFILDQNLLTLLAGQTVSYYVVAQDAAIAPNIWYNVLDAAVNHTSVSAQVAPPTTPTTYIISGVMSGTYNVPGQFSSLTKAGGIFQAINNSTIGGNIIVNITADLDENGVNGLDIWADGVNNYTLLVQPNAGVQRIISNSTNVATAVVMIRINTAVSTTIDGRFAGAGQFLLFRNTNTNPFNNGGTISYTNTTTAKQCILQYCVIESNTNANFKGAVMTGVGTNNVNINNCRVGDATGGTFGTTRNAIYTNGGTNHTFNIQNNEIYNFLDAGVYIDNSANACVVNNNVFYYNFVGSFPSNIVPISVLFGGGHTISNNVIGGNDATNSNFWSVTTSALFVAINVNTTNATLNNITGNTVKNINFAATSSNSLDFNAVVVRSLSRALVDNLTVTNIQIPTISSGFINFQVVLFNGGSSTLSNSNFSNIVVTNPNTSASSVFYLVNMTTSSTYTITRNTFSNITTKINASSVQHIIGNSASFPVMIISNNTIFNILVGGVAGDMRIIRSNVGLTTTTTVTGNRIYDIRSTSGAIFGIHAFSGNIITAYNQISITNGVAVNPLRIFGIYENTNVASTGQHYYNSVYIGGGQTSGTGITIASACYRKDNVNSIVDVRNNIFINERTSTGAGTIKNVAIASTTSVPETNWSSNYNLLVVANNVNSAVGFWNTATINFAAWQTLMIADKNSWIATANTFTDHSNINVGNFFADLANGNLDINVTSATSWFANGKGTQIATYTGDYGSSGVVRSDVLVNGGTDLGADEFVAVTTPIPALVGGSHTPSGTETFTFGGRQVAQITWGAGGTLPVLGDMLYYSGENPPTPSAGARYFNAYWTMEGVGGAGYDYDMTLNYDKALLGTITLTEDASNTICLSKKPSAGTDWTTYLVGSVHTSVSNTLSKGALNSFSNFTGSIFVAPLPLTLLSFDAKRQNDSKIVINWLTTNELNLDYFVVERSYDAKNFVEVANVSAENPTTSIKNYILSIEDKKAVYLRLKFVHYQQNGVPSVEDNYSKVIFVGNGEEKDAILVYPNPMNADNLANVRFAVSKNLQNETVNLQIINNQGKTVTNFAGTFTEIEKQIPQNVQNLANGVYIWRFVVNNKTIKTLKISVE